MVEKVGVFGLGLIGGSIALRLKDGCRVVGVDPDAATRAAARETGIETAADVTAFAGCDVVFVCVPLERTADCIRQVHETVGETAVITDVASVKGFLQPMELPRFVGGHPMAGTEHSGFAAARPHLFENAWYPLVPFAASKADVAVVGRLVERLGARPLQLDADTHDRYVAEISHLPHLLSYALAALPDRAMTVAGTGFYDMTRVAASDPSFWTRVLSLNRDNVLCALDRFEQRTARIRQALEQTDEQELCALLTRGQTGRRRLEEDKLCLDEYELYVDVVDRPGAVEQVSGTLSRAGINVKSLAIVRSREGVGGALRLGFGSRAERDQARQLLAPSVGRVNCE